MAKISDAADLLKKLVETPSISKDEDAVCGVVRDWLNDAGLNASVHKKNVLCSIGKGKSTLLLNSHMDTVPVCPGWTYEPFRATLKQGRMYGLGSNDAKGSVAAMMNAMAKLADEELEGKLIFAASCEEEVSNSGIVNVMEKIGKVDAAVIGEPTDLDIAVAMRGMMILKFKARGRSCHASRPQEGVNAIYKAMGDIDRLRRMEFPKKHPLLGEPIIAVTMINAGTKNNVIPGECEFTANIRTTPYHKNAEVLEKIRENTEAEIAVQSNRFYPKETCEDERIVVAAKKANPSAKLTGLLGACDYAFVDAPGIIMGPGTSKESHAPNESIEIAQVEKAAGIYAGIARNFSLRKA